MGRVRLVKIQMGRVWTPAPAVKVVTMISSKERAKASRPPASRAERRAGKVTRRKVWTPPQGSGRPARCNVAAALPSSQLDRCDGGANG